MTCDQPDHFLLREGRALIGFKSLSGAPGISAPGMTIDGEIAYGPGDLRVINPATEEPFLEVPAAEIAQLDRAVRAARKATAQWRIRSSADRQDLVRKFGSTILEHIDELALMLTLEQGKPLADSVAEIRYGVKYCNSFAAIDIPTEMVRDAPSELVEVRHAPVGVVGAITPWNYPVMLALWKIAPALLAGNPVILKPSPFTPVTTLRMGELAADVFPAAVLQVLSGDDNLGKALAIHDGIDKIAFTGSSSAGRSVMRAAAHTLKRLTLELGGNDAAIVLEDADPQAVAEEIVLAAMVNGGQACTAIKRLYVPERRFQEHAEALSAAAARIVVGNGLEPGVTMGPVQNGHQKARIDSLLSTSVARGATTLFAGRVPLGAGYFHPVTLLHCTEDDLPMVAQEQFGPVLPVLTYRDTDEAVARANTSPFALGASVWSTDELRAELVADDLEAGTVWINQHAVLSPDVPFGGIKQSGIGVESARDGLMEYTNVRVRRIRRHP